MSFRCRQKFVLACSGPVYEVESKTLESGEIVEELKDTTKEKLPVPELFDLKNQIDAGVDMEEVSSKIFRPKTINADTIVRKYTKKADNVDTDN